MTDAFAPLAKTKKSAAKPDGWSCVTPVPDDAPALQNRHPRLGKPSIIWRYCDRPGRLLGYVLRFEKKDGGKEFRPLTLWCGPSGALEWRWESWPAPRQIYGLNKLTIRPDAPIVICEGEKAADAAADLLPDHIAITSPNGAKAAGKADWSPIGGRQIFIWRDADQPGEAYAEEVARLCIKAGAASVYLVAPPQGVAEGWDAADALAEGWTKQQAAELIANAGPFATPAPRDASSDPAPAPKTRKPRTPIRDILIGLVGDCTFWHSPDGVAYVTFPLGDHSENWRVRSRQFKAWLTRRTYLEGKQTPSAQAVDDALRHLEAIALYDGPERKPFLRVAVVGERWYIDLCDQKWRVVEITRDGWSVLEKHMISFVRSDAMLALPEPVAGHLIEDMRRFVNVASDGDYILVVAWLVAALHDFEGYPILIFQGEQGTGKSTLSMLLRSLVDPNVAPIRAQPKDEEDLLIAAKNGHVLAVDNLSRVDSIMSDALCRVATGGGFSTRVKYTNDEECVFWVCNPILLNGIPALAERPDLARRAIVVHLEPLPSEECRPEDEFWRDWRTVAPGVLGSLCDALSCALRRLPEIKLARTSSMARFEKLIEAASPALGLEAGEFSSIYAENRSNLEGASFEANPVAMAIDDLIRDDYPRGLHCTATRLLELVNSKVSESTKRMASWPKSAQSIGNQIERVKPLLRARGIIVERRHSGERTITIAPKTPEGGTP